jgi:hypothetical protein
MNLFVSVWFDMLTGWGDRAPCFILAARLPPPTLGSQFWFVVLFWTLSIVELLKFLFVWIMLILRPSRPGPTLPG